MGSRFGMPAALRRRIRAGHAANKLMRHLGGSCARALETKERSNCIIMETRLGTEAEEEW